MSVGGGDCNLHWIMAIPKKVGHYYSTAKIEQSTSLFDSGREGKWVTENKF